MSDNVRRLCRAICDKDEATWRQLLGVMTSRETNTAGDEYGSRPLHWACAKNNVPAAVDLLQTPGIEVNVLNSYGNTPIIWAVWDCNREVVEVMVRDSRVELGEGLEKQVRRWGGSEQNKQEIVRMIREERRRREEKSIS